MAGGQSGLPAIQFEKSTAKECGKQQSGANINRPHLQEPLHDVQSRSVPIDVVLVWRLDRLSRSQVDTLKLIDFFTKHKVAFKSVTEPFDTATPLGQAMLGMLSTFAQFERILDKVNELMAPCDELEAQIHSKATTYSHLLEATLREALAGG